MRLLLPSPLSTRTFDEINPLMPKQPDLSPANERTLASVESLLPALKATVAESLAHIQTSRVVLALSGGMDSMLLLELLYRLGLSSSVQAVYVHHGLSENADAWGQFCQMQCQQRGIAFAIAPVIIPDKTRNIEAQARELRYQALSRFVTSPTHALLTAHHADDQLETLLLALKRGSGLDGLTGIAASKVFANGYLLRPLLAFSRQELQQVASHMGLAWIDDESNSNQDFDRNFLREQVLPLLNQRFARFSQNAHRSAQLLQQTQRWQQQQLASRLADMAAADRLDLNKLEQQDKFSQSLLLRAFAKQHNVQLSQQQLDILQMEVIAAKPDAMAKLQLGSWLFRRFQHYLYLQPQALAYPALPPTKVRWRQMLETADGWYFWSDTAPDFLDNGASSYSCLPLDVIHSADVSLQSMPMSTLFKPADRPTKPLKQWCQLWNIPPWQRPALPAVVVAQRVVAIAGYASSCRGAEAKSWLWQGPLLRASEV